MMKRIFAAALAAAFLAAVSAPPALAQGTAPAKKEDTKAPAKDAKAPAKDAKKADTKGEKKLTPQQQKMKDCAAKWGDEKKAKKVSGRKAYNEFMKGCLKN